MPQQIVVDLQGNKFMVGADGKETPMPGGQGPVAPPPAPKPNVGAAPKTNTGSITATSPLQLGEAGIGTGPQLTMKGSPITGGRVRGALKTGLEGAELTAPFAAAFAPEVGIPAAGIRALLPALEGLFGAGHAKLSGEDPLMGAAQQTGLQLLPEVGNMASRGTNRAGMFVGRVPNETATGDSLVQTLARLRADQRGTTPGADPYGRGPAAAAAAARTAPQPGAIPPGATISSGPSSRPSIMDIIKRGTGINPNPFNRVTPFGAVDRFAAEREAAGKANQTLEEGAPASLTAPTASVMDRNSPELAAVRAKARTSPVSSPESQAEISAETNRLQRNVGGTQHGAATGNPNVDTPQLAALRAAVDEKRATAAVQAGQPAPAPLSDQEFNDWLLAGKTTNVRGLGDITRGARDSGNIAGRIARINAGKRPGTDMTELTDLAQAQRARTIQEGLYPPVKPSNARMSDIYGAEAGSNAVKGGMPTSLSPQRMIAASPTVRAAVAQMLSRGGNYGASASEAAPFLLRLQQLFSGGGTPSGGGQ